jgi:hypothetical protein
MMMIILIRVCDLIKVKKSRLSIRFKSCSHIGTRHIIVPLIFIALLLTFTPVLFLDLKAQLDDTNSSDLRRPTTSKVVPLNYTAMTNANDLSLHEIQPMVSEALSSDKKIGSPLTASPSYTVTNATVTFGTDILTSNHTSNELNIFIANTSQAIINGTSYK